MLAKQLTSTGDLLWSALLLLTNIFTAFQLCEAARESIDEKGVKRMQSLKRK